MNELKQGSSEWLKLRKQYVTATDAAVILGLSPFKTPYKLWRQKMDLDPPDEENDAMRRGTELEPIARKWLADKHKIRSQPAVLTRDFMMASLDGLSECGRCIVEIKCGKKSYEQALKGEIPEYYKCQMQHQMYVANVEIAMYICFDGENGLLMSCEKDQEFINEMLEREREFYQCLLTFTPPTLTTKDYQMRSDPTWNNLAENYRKAYQDLKSAELLEESLRKELISLAGQQSTMGNGIKLSKVVKRGAINYSSIPQLIGLNLDEYRKNPSEYFRISVE